MKKLIEFINENTISESMKNKDIEKVEKFMDNDKKVEKFIKDNGLRYVDDMDNIKDAIYDCHRIIRYYDELQNIDNFSKYIDDETRDLYDKYDRDIVNEAKKLYKLIFKKITGKL